LSVKRRIIFGIASGWGSKAVGILLNLVQIPLLYRYLPAEIVGLWFLMIGAQMVVGVFDLGFGQTLQRRIAFAKGTCGSDPGAPGGFSPLAGAGTPQIHSGIILVSCGDLQNFQDIHD
jgi:hypothetical protein